MTRDQLYERRQANSRYELTLLIAGWAAFVTAVFTLLGGKVEIAVALTVLSALAFGLARVVVALDGLADQIESVERRLQEKNGAEGESASQGAP